MNDESRQAFREFALARTPALLRTAYLLTGGQHDAEDLVQTALTRAMTRWRHIRHRDPEAYVRRIMYHEQVSWWRRRARRREYPTDTMPEQPVADPNTATDLRLSVRRTLQQLTPHQRAVLVLRYFDDLPEAQVADILGCSVGSVRTHVHRAMTKFRSLAPSLAIPSGQR